MLLKLKLVFTENEEDETLNSGRLFWFKSQRRGEVAVPIRYLTEEQKKTLRSGLASERYELCNPYQYFTTYYMWLDDERGVFFLVTDIELSLEIKKKLSPATPPSDSKLFRVTLSNVEALQKEFKQGKVDERYVERILDEAPWKPWVEKDWKEERDKLIKRFCEQCGSQENLILQHTIQPRKINSILYQLVSERLDEFNLYVEQNKDSIELTYPDDIQKVPVCPKCGSSQVHLRTNGVNKGTYVCKKSRNYVVCKNQFVHPEFGYSEVDIKTAEKKRVSLLRDSFCEKEGLLRKATEMTLDEIVTYLELTHTKTLCSKCAFKEDRPFEKYW